MRQRAALIVLLAVAALACGSRSASDTGAQVAAPACPAFTAASAGLPVEGEWKTHPAIGDVNEDGFADIAALARKGDGPSVFLGDGFGKWTEASQGLKFGRGFSCGIGTRLADVSKDGHLDLVVADHCKGVLVYLGNGGEAWVEASRGIPRNQQGFNDADVGDVTGDGILDVVAISAFSRGFLVLGGDGAGNWRIVADTGLPTTGTGFELHLVDVTGDGLLDVLCTFTPVTTERREAIPPPSKVWIQGPVGRFAPGQGFSDQGRFFGLATLTRADSPRRDVLFALAGTRAGLYRFESPSGDAWLDVGRIDESWFGDPALGFIGVDTIDFDGDGCEDVVASGGNEIRVWIALGDCHGNWRLCPAGTLPLDGPPLPGWGLAAGDLNGDGRPDVVAGFGSGSRGGLKAWMQSAP